MGLELRKRKDGTLIKHWFGACKDSTGRRVIKSLTTPIPADAVVPSSLRDDGDAKFEISRAAASKELEDFQNEERKKGRALHLKEDLIEAKTGRKWKEMPLADLPGFTKTMKGIRSKDWQTWQVDVVGKFVAWAKERGLRSTLEVTPEIAEAYVECLGEPDDKGKAKTPKTVRHIKSILVLVLGRVLPDGVENPFKKIRVETPDGGETEHRKPLNAVEVDLLLAEAATDPFVFPLIVTALSTGLRRGDVCTLKWSSVNLKDRILTVRTSKTGAAVTLPIMDRLHCVLEGVLAERREAEVYVFPEAERMLRENPDGITYRVKKVFARAFEKPEEATVVEEKTTKHVKLSDVLQDVLKAVDSASMAAGKRAKLVDLLNLYASGKSYREIQAERTISRGAISGLLHEAEKLVGMSFLPDTSAKKSSVRKAVQDVTRQARKIGMRDASKYDFHALRTTFVTLALGAKNPMPVEKVIALTGHRTVETAMKYYFKPKGSDFKNELEAAMPQSLSTRKGAGLATQENDPLANLAEQLKKLTETDKVRLAMLLKT